MGLVNDLRQTAPPLPREKSQVGKRRIKTVIFFNSCHKDGQWRIIADEYIFRRGRRQDGLASGGKVD